MRDMAFFRPGPVYGTSRGGSILASRSGFPDRCCGDGTIRSVSFRSRTEWNGKRQVLTAASEGTTTAILCWTYLLVFKDLSMCST